MTTQPGASALTLRALEKSFPIGFLRGSRPVLRGIDLEVAPGERLGLVGPNGSGKSTLLRVAAGVEPAGGGLVRVFGADPRDPEARSRIGFLPEASPFPPELTARAVVDLTGSLFGLPAAERRTRGDEMLARAGLAAEAGRTLGRFSLGMLRRLGLALAFLHRPDLLLLDEPTAGLDAPGHVVLDELLGEARRRRAALVVSTHQLADVLDHCDRLAILIDGRIAASGAPLELLSSEGRVRLEIEGLAPAALEEVEREIERAGGRIVSRGPARGALVELYRSRRAP